MSEFAVFKFKDELMSSYLRVRRFFIHCLQRSDYQVNIIETKRLILKEYSYKDTPELNKILSNPKTMSFWPAPFTEQQTENWIHNNIKRYKELGFGRWAVILKETNELIGDCGIMISEIDGKQENDLGYIFHYPYWKKGYAVEAAEACKEHAFSNLGIQRLCANMAFDHKASRRVAEKIGMKKEKEFYNSRNRNILTYLYSLSFLILKH
jgi:[ribosomal protein S5]-alanine N-acetyltransferase